MDLSTIDNTEDESDELFSGNDTSVQIYICTNYLYVCSTVVTFFFIRKFLDDEQKKEIKRDVLILNRLKTPNSSTM